jgi:hypothetical protein
MATTLHRVRQNFIWRMENITPTATLANLRTGFVHIDPTRESADPAASRTFSLRWLRAEEDHGITDGASYEANHFWQLDVNYAAALGYANVQDIGLQDRFDVLGDLQESNLVGYDADNTSTELNLHSRTREDDELITDSEITWVWRYVWRTNIRER